MAEAIERGAGPHFRYDLQRGLLTINGYGAAAAGRKRSSSGDATDGVSLRSCYRCHCHRHCCATIALTPTATTTTTTERGEADTDITMS